MHDFLGLRMCLYLNVWLYVCLSLCLCRSVCVQSLLAYKCSGGFARISICYVTSADMFASLWSYVCVYVCLCLLVCLAVFVNLCVICLQVCVSMFASLPSYVFDQTETEEHTQTERERHSQTQIDWLALGRFTCLNYLILKTLPINMHHLQLATLKFLSPSSFGVIRETTFTQTERNE